MVKEGEVWRAAVHGGHKVSDTTERLNNNQLRSRKVNWNKDRRSWVSSESRGSAGSSPLPASGP